jgi:hypothetical protein
MSSEPQQVLDRPADGTEIGFATNEEAGEADVPSAPTPSTEYRGRPPSRVNVGSVAARRGRYCGSVGTA